MFAENGVQLLIAFIQVFSNFDKKTLLFPMTEE